LRRSGGGFASRSQARKLGRTRVTPKAAWAFLAPGVSSHHESREALAVKKVAELARIGDVLGPVKKIELRTPLRDIGETHNESRDRNSERGNAGGRSNGTSSDDEAPQRN